MSYFPIGNPMVSSPLLCLTSVFGMGTGVSTVLKSPDCLKNSVLRKLDIIVNHALNLIKPKF